METGPSAGALQIPCSRTGFTPEAERRGDSASGDPALGPRTGARRGSRL